jgi:hypothetical protein
VLNILALPVLLLNLNLKTITFWIGSQFRMNNEGQWPIINGQFSQLCLDFIRLCQEAPLEDLQYVFAKLDRARTDSYEDVLRSFRPDNFNGLRNNFLHDLINIALAVLYEYGPYVLLDIVRENTR